MRKPEKRYTFCYKKNHLKKKYINMLYIGQMDLQNNNLDKQQQAKLAKYISKLEKEKQLRKAIKIKEKHQKSPQPHKEEITKIVSSKKKAYESFNVEIINNKDPQVQLHKSKELTKDFRIGKLNKNYGIKINIRLNIFYEAN